MGRFAAIVDSLPDLDWSAWGPPLALVLVVLLLVQSLRLWWQGSAAARRVARHRRLGSDGEKLARQMLRRAGYKIVAEQKTQSYALRVDGENVTVHLRSDFVVRKGRMCFVAEAKSGAASARITGRATRRQLLEYLFAFEVDGVLLIDVEQRKIHLVEFPEPKTQRVAS